MTDLDDIFVSVSYVYDIYASHYGEACDITIGGIDPPFRTTFNMCDLRIGRDVWESVIRKIATEVEDWLLSLPGDIHEIEKQVKHLLSEKFFKFVQQECQGYAMNFGKTKKDKRSVAKEIYEEDFDPLEILLRGTEEEKRELEQLMRKTTHP